MRLDGQEQSTNVEDRRGARGPAMAAGGGGLLLVVMMVVMNLMGVGRNEQRVAIEVAKSIQQRNAGAPATGEGINDESRVFIARILKSTENVWTKQFKEHVEGSGYTPPKLVIFGGSVQTRCGIGSAEMGPFYCPGDSQVYIDPAFFDELASRHRASGDFAQAYVIAHEVAHHVQNLTGFSQQVDEARRKGDELIINQMSVRLELQADYLAGVWAHYADKEYNILESGDIEEGINAANRIGDDTLQMEAQGYKVPERYTHGTSAQRAKWFKKGQSSGDFEGCAELFKVAYERL